MRSDVEKIYKMFVEDEFYELWLQDIKNIKNENYIIYDEEGTMINGKWINSIYDSQKPGIKVLNDTNYAVYDMRYNKKATIYKKYSEFIHELFHCLQIKNKVELRNKKMIEGAALFVECIVASRYMEMSIKELIIQYGIEMKDFKYRDYYKGAIHLYNEFEEGNTWKDYFQMKNWSE